VGLLSPDADTYFITEDGLKYRLANEGVKMCVTEEDALDWIKRIHEYQVPHLTIKEVLTQVHKGPYWWPTISSDVTHLTDKCTPCQNTTTSGLKIENYGAILL
jgi:hypothetical protein